MLKTDSMSDAFTTPTCKVKNVTKVKREVGKVKKGNQAPKKKNTLRDLLHLTQVVRTAGVKLRCLAHSKLKKTSLITKSAWRLTKIRVSGMWMKLYFLPIFNFLLRYFYLFVILVIKRS